MKTKNYLSNVPTCGAWLLNAIFAGMLPYVLLLQSCAGSKPVAGKSREVLTDSVAEKLVVTAKPLTVPRSQAFLLLKPENMARMPEGSKYTAHNGQASVEAWQKGDTLFVTAVCDSLQLLVESQYYEIKRLQRTVNEKEGVIRQGISWKEKITGTLRLVFIGAGLLLAVQGIGKIKKAFIH